MLTVGFILHAGFSAMGLAPVSAFEFANEHSGERLYDVRMLSRDGGRVHGAMGVIVETEALSPDRYFDLLIVNGGLDDEITPDMVDFIREAPARSRRIAAICTGAFLLAEAGLLDGRRATTHWVTARRMQARFPKVKVDEDRIYIGDGGVWTSAGMSAGIDLVLAFIEEEHGADLARAVARKLVLYHRRSGGQSQFSTLLELSPKSDRIQKALTYARRNLSNRLSVEELAEVASLSPRQFSRLFQSETGQSPAKAVEHLRLEAARAMMEETAHPIDVVARQTGFADRDRMRRAFLRTFGQPPQVLRRANRGALDA